MQRQAAAEAFAHRPGTAQPGRRSVAGKAGTGELRRLQILEFDLDQVRELQVIEEQVEEFLLRQRKGEFILAFAIRTALAASAAAPALRLGDLVADPILLVARQNVVAGAGVATQRKVGLAQTLGADRDLLGTLGFGDFARFQRFLDGLADLGLGTAQKALAIAKALGLRIEAAIDDLHEFPSHCSRAEYAANGWDRKGRQRAAGAAKCTSAAVSGCCSARFLYPHVPFNQAAHLAWCVAALDHALHELLVLLFGLAVLLLAEADHRQ